MKKNKGAGIIFLCDNQVLLLKNDKGIWEIPGGKRDKGEKYLDTARRETSEECSKCPAFTLFGNFVYENLKNKYKVYFAKINKKFNCQISDEHQDWGWFNIKKLPRPLHNKVIGALNFLNDNLLTLDNINSV